MLSHIQKLSFSVPWESLGPSRSAKLVLALLANKRRDLRKAKKRMQFLGSCVSDVSHITDSLGMRSSYLLDKIEHEIRGLEMADAEFGSEELLRLGADNSPDTQKNMEKTEVSTEIK